MDNLKMWAARAASRRLRARAGRLAAILLAANAASACVVPGNMHVTEGIAPQNIDTHVRFRTTYYFRVFDYCWAANEDYRKIVPETDTLYRYRMTGKAPSLTNKIKFESGILDANTIDPFGADVVYNSDINGYLVRSQEEARQQAKARAAAREAEMARNSALERFQTLADMLAAANASDPKPTEKIEQIKAAMKDALADFTGTLRAPMSSELKTKLDLIQGLVEKIGKGTETAAATPPTKDDLEGARVLFTAAVDKQIKELLKAATPAAQACTANETLKRGFQIMGPEGMRPFDQQQRLIMAMSSSAKPLVETLNEYSGRILKPQVNTAEQLLPLARETTSVVDAQRAVYQEALVVSGKDPATARISTLFDAAAKAFTPEAK